MPESARAKVRILPAGEGEYEFTTLGEDPWIELRWFASADVSPDETVLAFEYFSPEGVDGPEVFYGPPIQATRRFAAGALGRADEADRAGRRPGTTMRRPTTST